MLLERVERRQHVVRTEAERPCEHLARDRPERLEAASHELAQRNLAIDGARSAEDGELLGRDRTRQRELDVGQPLGADPYGAGTRQLDDGRAPVGSQAFEQRRPNRALRRRHETEQHQRIVQLVGIQHRRPGFTAHALDRFGVELAELGRLLRRHVAAGLHRERAPLLGRRVVEERVGLGAEDLLRERRRARELAANDFDFAGLDTLQHLHEAFDVHRRGQAVLERLLDERVVGNLAIAAGQVLGAGKLIGEHRRQQILRVHALKLRGLLLAVTEPPHGERDARVPAPVHAEQRRIEDRLRQHVPHRFARKVTRDVLEREAVHGAEREHDRVLERRGLELEVEAPAKPLA